MALARRSGSRFEANIWPGFVDAMTALLLVLMFVLSVFMIIQSVLRETISGQDKELDSLSQQVSGLFDQLGLAQQNEARLEDEVTSLSGDISSLEAERAAQAALLADLTGERDAANAQAAAFEEQVASLLARNNDLNTTLLQTSSRLTATQAELEAAEGNLNSANTVLAAREQELSDRKDDLNKTRATLAALEAANAREITQKEALQLALAQARDEIDESVENARLAAARSDALDALIADLQADLAARDSSLASQGSRLEETLALLALNQTNLEDTQAALAASEEGNQEAQRAIEAREAELERNKAALLEQGRVASISLEEMRTRIASLETELSEGEKQRLVEAAAVQALRDRLKNSSTELTAMTLALEEKRREAEETLTLLAAAQSVAANLRTSQADQLNERQRQAALLATARQELTRERTLSADNRRKLTLLNQQTVQLRRQLASLQQLLDAAKAKDEERNVEVQNLGSQLNTALAQVAAEQKALAEEQQRIAELERRERVRLQEEALDLRRYRSEFFARVGEVLKDREGVQIQGDRFVFSSEVLFAPGSAVLGNGGRNQIARVASVIREVSDAIPESVDWVLRVDGHTDNVPLSGFGEFSDNWELSQARALSVVKYLVATQGIPPDRLAANGFGEFQPVDYDDSDAARAKNRRIELKFTER